MTTRKIRKKVVREYKIDTFMAYQNGIVSEREQSIHEILMLLGKSELKFPNITKLANHICAMLKIEGKTCNTTTLVRKSHTRDGTETPNPYRLLLHKYLSGKYFGTAKNPSITAQDIKEIRKKYPAVDAYCSLKEGESKNLQEQVKHLTREIDSLKGGKSLLPERSATGELPDHLDKTVTALKRLIDVNAEFIEIDWQKRAIVDISHRDPKVVVESDLLTAFFRALENSGMKPPEGT